MHALAQPLLAPRYLAAKRLGQLTLATLSAGAAGIHAWVIPEHVQEYRLFGAFFAAVAVGQAAWALAVLRCPSWPVRRAGIVLSAGLLALWALSRTAGLPVGPEAWATEPAGLLDITAGVAELGIIVAAGITPRWRDAPSV